MCLRFLVSPCLSVSLSVLRRDMHLCLYVYMCAFLHVFLFVFVRVCVYIGVGVALMCVY